MVDSLSDLDNLLCRYNWDTICSCSFNFNITLLNADFRQEQDIGEFKKLLRRRRRQRRLKNEFIFTYESRNTLKSFTLFITVKAIAKLNLGHRNEFEIEFYKISRRSSRSSDNAELVISRCCFAEDGKEMYKKL